MKQGESDLLEVQYDRLLWKPSILVTKKKTSRDNEIAADARRSAGIGNKYLRFHGCFHFPETY